MILQNVIFSLIIANNICDDIRLRMLSILWIMLRYDLIMVYEL
jgi:hypothetical protein